MRDLMLFLVVLIFSVTEKVATPKIFYVGHDNNLFYFQMEYVVGKTMAEFLKV